MSSRIVPRVARVRPTGEEIRLAALVSIEARRVRIAAASAKLEVPASEQHIQFAPLNAHRQVRFPAPARPNEEAWTDAKPLNRISPGPPRPCSLDKLSCPSPAPLGQNDLVVASGEALALHKIYGRSYMASDQARWNQWKIQYDMISGERLSRKSRPQRRLRFRAGDVTRTRIVSRWMSEVAEEDSESEEVSLPEISMPEKIFEDWGG